MNFQSIFSFALLLVSLFFIVSLKQWRKSRKIDYIPNMPPGPWKLPIIGNIHQLVGSPPHRKLRELANTYGPLMHLQLGEVSFIIVSSAEYAKEIMKTHDVIFASRRNTISSKILFYDSTDIVYAPYGGYWRKIKNISNMELLSLKHVKSLWPIREEEVTNLIKRIALEEGSVINLSHEVISTIYSFTSRAAFGKNYKEQDEFIKLVREALKILGGFHIEDLFPSANWLQNLSRLRPKLEKLHKNIDRILDNIINDHKEAKVGTKEALVEGMEDLTDVLLKFEDSSCNRDFCLTKRNVKAIIFDIFFGGSDTSATTINWAMAEMLKNPRVLKNAQDEVRMVLKRRGRVDETCITELKYLKAIIKEVLRLHPPVPLILPRICEQACEIDGHHIPFKSTVIVNAWAIGRAPKYWIDPEKFSPERFIDSSVDFKGTNFEYIPFGAGRRICPGINYAMANVELVLTLLLYHFDWKLPAGMKNEDLDMTELFGMVVKRKADLNIIPKTYASLE